MSAVNEKYPKARLCAWMAAVGLCAVAVTTLALLFATSRKVTGPLPSIALLVADTNGPNTVFQAWVTNRSATRIRLFPAVIQCQQQRGMVIQSFGAPWNEQSDFMRLRPAAVASCRFTASDTTQEVKVLVQYEWPAGILQRAVGQLLLHSPWKRSSGLSLWLRDRGLLATALLDTSWTENPLFGANTTGSPGVSDRAKAPAMSLGFGNVSNLTGSALGAVPLYTRVVLADQLDHLKNVRGLDPRKRLDQLLADYLAQNGVVLSPPRFVTVEDQMVTVKASLSELDKVQELLIKLRSE